MDFSKCKAYGIELIEQADRKCRNCICSVCSIAQSNGGAPGCGNCDACNAKKPCNSCPDFYFALRPRPFETDACQKLEEMETNEDRINNIELKLNTLRDRLDYLESIISPPNISI